MIISVHIPRTAGSNFRAFLEDHLLERLYLDYGDPILVGKAIRNSVAISRNLFMKFQANKFEDYDCIHGHFMPSKYDHIKISNPQYVMWLRDPVDRLVSHYYFLKNNVAEQKRKSPFQEKVIRQNWSLEAFCFDNTMKNLVSKMLNNFSIDRFDFIGITHNYNDDIIRFSKKYFNIKKPYIRKSVNKNSMFTAYDEIEQEFREQVLKFHRADKTLYDEALKLRLEQITGRSN